MSSKQQYSLHEASFILLESFLPSSPPLSAWGALQWIIQPLLHHNINIEIDAPLLFGDVSLCAVQCVEMMVLCGIQGLTDQKRVVTQSISPPALISMSTVKPPPMSRLGEEKKRGRARTLLCMCHQTAAKSGPFFLYCAERTLSSSVGRRRGVVVSESELYLYRAKV